MNPVLPLMQREWLQHRFAWALMVLVPLALAVLSLTVSRLDMNSAELQMEMPLPHDRLATVMALASMASGVGMQFAVMWVSSLIIISGLARRDHGDRSVEFWLSLPVSHSTSLAVPMLVHLLLVPAAALLIGLGLGWLVSALVVGRTLSLSDWWSIPWGSVLPAALAIVGRLLSGLVLATLWLSPLILLLMLATAWFRRWGLAVFVLGLGLGGWVLDRLFGQPLVINLLLDLVAHAGQALFGAGQGGLRISPEDDTVVLLRQLPAWVVADLWAALKAAVSPLFIGALLFAAGCFAALVQWRRQGASATV